MSNNKSLIGSDIYDHSDDSDSGEIGLHGRWESMTPLDPNESVRNSPDDESVSFSVSDNDTDDDSEDEEFDSDNDYNLDDNEEDSDEENDGEDARSEEHDEEVKLTGSRAEKRIKKLTYRTKEAERNLQAAEAARQEAIDLANRLAQENEQMKVYLTEGERVILDEVRRGTKEAYEYAKRDYKQAMENGDTDEIIAAQEKLSRAQHDFIQAESYKTYSQPQGVTPPQGQSVQIQNQQPQQFQSNAQPQAQNLDEKTQAWLKKNTWFHTDPEMQGTALGIHQRLIRSGVNPSDESYYKEIDKGMRKRYPEFFEGTGEPASQDRRIRKPSVVAPSSRTSGNSGNTVKLTPRQVKLARRLGISTELYAKQVLKENS